MATIEQINAKDRTALLSDGRTVPIPKDVQDDLFETKYGTESRTKAYGGLKGVYDDVSQLPYGKELSSGFTSTTQSSGLLNLANSAIMDAGNAAVDMWRNKNRQEGDSLTQEFLERYKGARRGREQIYKEIQEESPTSAKVGTGLGIATDVLAPLGKLKAGTQAALVGSGLSEHSLLDEPMEFLKDAGQNYALGWGVGKLTSIPGKISGARKGIRQAAQNAEDFVQREAQAATNFSNQQAAHQANLASLPAQQAQAQAQFSQGVLSHAGGLSKDISSSRLAREAIGLDNFINTTVNSSALAGSKNGNNLSNFLKKVVGSRPTEMSAQDIGHIYQAVESRIGQGLAHELPILNQFKSHLAKVLPDAAAEASAWRIYGKRVGKDIAKGIEQTFKNTFKKRKVGFFPVAEPHLGQGFLDVVHTSMADEISTAIANGQIKNFGTKVSNGKIVDEILPLIQNNPEYLALHNKIDQLLLNAQQSGMTSKSQQALGNVKQLLVAAEQDFASNILGKMSTNQNNVAIEMRDAAGKVSKRLSNTIGSAPIIQPPSAPVAPIPGTPPDPFVAGNMYERLAESFESPNFLLNTMGFNPKEGLMKKGIKGAAAMGAMKMIPGAGQVLPAAYLANLGVKTGLKGLSGTGAIAGGMRSLIEGGGRRLAGGEVSNVIKEIASKFPSYHDGVLDSPEDRRAAVHEIENNPRIGLEDKAMLQANINRGKPLE